MVDVLILVALQDELAALKAVLEGEYGAHCRAVREGNLLPHWRAELPRGEGGALTLALVLPPGMGATDAANVAGQFTASLKPGMLAMCGICAGHREKVTCGDVIVADAVWEVTPAGWNKMNAFRPAAGHLIALKDFAQSWPAPKDRPETLETLGDRLLLRLEKRQEGEASFEEPALQSLLPEVVERKAVLDDLRRRKRLYKGALKATEDGRRRARKIRREEGGTIQDRSFGVRLGAMAMVDAVVRRAGIFEELRAKERETLALDMESYAVGLSAWLGAVPGGHLVVKGVQDYADPDKDDRFRTYGARAAAHFLLDYLRGHVTPQERDGPKLTFPDILPANDPRNLLLPESDAVPFLGRQREMAELAGWCAKEDRVSLRVLVGEGGTGKTRLAMELCRAMGGMGWNSGFFKRSDLEAFFQDQTWNRWFPDADTLVVIDYAAGVEGRLNRWLESLTVPGQGVSRLRLLLLERHASPEGGWFQRLFHDGSDSAARRAARLNPPDPVAVPDLPVEMRNALLQAIVAAVKGGVRIPQAGADPAFDADLAASEWWGHPLYLLMAGLEMGDQGQTRPVLRMKKPELALARGRREVSRLQAHYAGEDDRLRALLPHLAAQVTLCGGLSRGEVVRLARGEINALGYSPDPGVLANRLQEQFPAPEGGVAPLRPDILGEALVLLALQEGEESLPRAHAVKPVVESLVRLAEDFPPGLYPKPLAWFRALVEGMTDLESLEGIADQFPKYSLPLLELMADAETRMVALARALPPGEERDRKIAWHLNDLGVRLNALGRREEAMAATREAVDLYRNLAEQRPEAFRPDLAMSLNNLGMMLSTLGRREESLAATREAVDLYRILAEQHPEVFRSALARPLNNLGVMLSDLGRREEALAATREGVDLYRILAEQSPEAFRPDLAGALNNLGNRLSALGRREEALAATREAVEIRRILAEHRPEAFRPDLAMSLNNLGLTLSDLGLREEAYSASLEAVEIRRILAEQRPEAFRHDLAVSLNNLGAMLGALGRWEEALAATREAVDLYRILAEHRPEAFRPDLAMSLGLMSRILNQGGQYAEALPLAEEAFELLWPFYQAWPEAMKGLMGGVLEDYLTALEETGSETPQGLRAAVEEALKGLLGG